MMRNQRHSLRDGERLTGWGFIAPALILFLIFVLLPATFMIALSFTKYNMLKPPEFVGAANYIRLFTNDGKFVKTAGNTALLTVLAVALNVGLSLLLALLISNQKNSVFSYFIRLFYFFPSIVAASYVAMVWSILLARDTGVLNYYLSQLGVAPIGWLNDKNVALFSIIGIDVWRSMGFYMIILLAGIKDISDQYYEAAALDGANRVQIATRITVPLLSRSLLFVTIINVINELKTFDIPKIMTDGNPADSTRTMAMYIYDCAFTKMNMGYASTVSLVFVVVIMAVTVFQFKLSGRWGSND